MHCLPAIFADARKSDAIPLPDIFILYASFKHLFFVLSVLLFQDDGPVCVCVCALFIILGTWGNLSIWKLIVFGPEKNVLNYFFDKRRMPGFIFSLFRSYSESGVRSFRLIFLWAYIFHVC